MNTILSDNLKETIKNNCKTYNDLVDSESYQYMHLNECTNSEVSGLYQLILNGKELWYGTLQEINTIVIFMITRYKRNNFLE